QPPDGQFSTGPVSTTQKPRVVINANFIPDSDVLYSGAAPGFVGLWQIDVRVPKDVPPGIDVPIVVTYGNIASNQDANGNIKRTTFRAVPTL
ncbi:MAG TPA: hypothetical protein VGV35_20280, partial [Bryobacteraceae bacterium]|nr:hypothetical protein [Bryobacteraceae bacterium]